MSYKGLTGRTKRTYLQIKQGSLFLKSSDKNHENYAEKSVEFGGETYVNAGLWFSKLTDKITRVSLYDGSFGLQVNIDTEEGYTISTPYDKRYGVSLMERLPNIDTGKEVTIAPYSFEDEKGRIVQGVNLYQDGNKIESLYTKENSEKYDFPQSPIDAGKKKITSADWKAFFMLRNNRLKDLLDEWIEEKYPDTGTEVAVNEQIQKATDSVTDASVDDLPF